MNSRPLLLLFTALYVTSNAFADISTRKAVKDDPKKEYFLIDHSEGKEPDDGYKLLLVLPGGDGTADFNSFVTNIGKHSAGTEYLVAQLVAVKWTPDQRIIWPTEESEVEDAKFTTEEFIEAVIADVGKTHKLDSEHVYTLSWSSSGPAAYAASMELKEIKGSFIAMSVFKPDQLPRLSKAKGKRYYIYHSPDDRICPIRMAKDAEEKLIEEGAEVKFVTYTGGHGWHGDIFGSLRDGIHWLEDR